MHSGVFDVMYVWPVVWPGGAARHNVGLNAAQRVGRVAGVAAGGPHLQRKVPQHGAGAAADPDLRGREAAGRVVWAQSGWDVVATSPPAPGGGRAS